jgi:hypothetical protein
MRTLSEIRGAVEELGQATLAFLPEDCLYQEEQRLERVVSELKQAVGDPCLVFNNADQLADQKAKTRRRIEDRLRRCDDEVWIVAKLLGIDIES